MKNYSIPFMVLIVLITALALVGWVFGIDFLINPVSGDSLAMNPVTAICMLLLSVSFLLQLRPRLGSSVQAVISGTAIAVMIVAAIKLLALFGIDLKIDHMLFAKQMSFLGTQGVRSRMAPNSAFSFILLGSVILLRSLPGHRLTFWPTSAALVVFFFGLFSFIGHIYRVEEYYGVFNYIPMAFETGVCFILFALALLHAHRRESFMYVISSAGTGGAIARRAIPFVILVPLSLGFIRLYIWWHYPFTVELGVAALISSIIFVSLCLLWYFARALNQSAEQLLQDEVQLKHQATLLQMMPGGVMYMTSDQRITKINHSAATMFGLDADTVIGQKVDDHLLLIFLTDPDPTLRYAALQRDGHWIGEIEVINKKTDKKVAVVSHNRLLASAGTEPMGYMMVFTDITERRISEERMALAIDGLAGGLWDWDIATNTPWWSPRYPELLGYDPNEMKASVEQFEKLVHPDDLKVFHGAIGYNRERHLQRFETELRYLTKAGVYKWFQVFAKITYSDQGIPLRIVGSIMDIDDKKKAQELIKMQSDLFGIMPDATLYGNRDLSIFDMNHAAELLFEIKKKDAIGRRIDELITIEVLSTSREDVRKDLWGEKGYWRGELNITTASDHTTKVLASLKAIKNEAGEATGWLGIYTNISLLQINEELTHALHKQEDNNKYLEQLAYISTHDLKSPIVAAYSLIDILIKRDGVKPEHREVLDLIKGTVEQMRRTNFALNDILKVRQDLVSKKDSVAIDLSPLSIIIKDVTITLQKNIEEKGGSVNIDLGQAEELMLPYLHFKSMLYNLMSNSIKYADPDRQLIIKITAEILPDGGLRFMVEDNAMGIDLTEHREKLFGVFKRFHSHVEGTGVGLHIVKSIIDIYDGNVIVKSKVGVGTIFDISFSATNIVSWN